MKMKKALSLTLILILCLSLFACSQTSKRKTLTKEEVTEAMADCNGTLSVEGSDDDLTAFTYVLEDVNAEDISDKDYVLGAAKTLLSDPSELTFGEYKVCKPILALMKADDLFRDPEEDFDASSFLDEMVGVICDGDALEYDGWTITAQVDQTADTVTIKVS